MNIIKYFKLGSKLDTECAICLGSIREKQKKVLPCKHVLHKVCFENLISSNCSKKCPTCRGELFPPEQCGVCKKVMELDEEKCDVLISKDCGCYFHYDCVKLTPIINNDCASIFCKNCLGEVSTYNMDALCYLHFITGHKKWICQIEKCKQEGCINECNPQRFGYCLYHSDKIARNTSIVLCLKYFVKYVREPLEEKRREIFYKVLEFIDKNYKEGSSFDISIVEISDRIFLEKVLQ